MLRKLFLFITLFFVGFICQGATCTPPGGIVTPEWINTNACYADLNEYVAAQPDNATITLSSGTFEIEVSPSSHYYADKNNRFGVRLKTGQTLVGQGKGSTTLQVVDMNLVDLENTWNGTNYLVEYVLVVTSDPNSTGGNSVRNLTIDCGWSSTIAQGNKFGKIDAVVIRGTNSLIENVRAINAVASWRDSGIDNASLDVASEEGFTLFIGNLTNNTTVTNARIASCDVENFYSTPKTMASLISMGGAQGGNPISGTITNCFVKGSPELIAYNGSFVKDYYVIGNIATNCGACYFTDTGNNTNVVIANNWFYYSGNGSKGISMISSGGIRNYQGYTISNNYFHGGVGSHHGIGVTLQSGGYIDDFHITRNTFNRDDSVTPGSNISGAAFWRQNGTDSFGDIVVSENIFYPNVGTHVYPPDSAGYQAYASSLQAFNNRYSTGFHHDKTIRNGRRLLSAGSLLNNDAYDDFLWYSPGASISGYEMAGTNALSGFWLNIDSTTWTTWRPVGMADFDADGYKDILLWGVANADSRKVMVRGMNGTNSLASYYLNGGNAVASGWSPVGIGDFNSDGQKDVLWQNTQTNLAVWLMNGTNISSDLVLANLPAMSSVATVQGVNDFNQDGKADIALLDTSNYETAYWRLNGTNYVSGAYIVETDGVTRPKVSAGWYMAKFSDYNNDGINDILWRKDSPTGSFIVWHLNSSSQVTSTNQFSYPGANMDGSELVNPD